MTCQVMRGPPAAGRWPSRRPSGAVPPPAARCASRRRLGGTAPRCAAGEGRGGRPRPSVRLRRAWPSTTSATARRQPVGEPVEHVVGEVEVGDEHEVVRGARWRRPGAHVGDDPVERPRQRRLRRPRSMPTAEKSTAVTCQPVAASHAAWRPRRHRRRAPARAASVRRPRPRSGSAPPTTAGRWPRSARPSGQHRAPAPAPPRAPDRAPTSPRSRSPIWAAFSPPRVLGGNLSSGRDDCRPDREPTKRPDRPTLAAMATTSTAIRDLAERHWKGEGDLVHAHHPVQPVLDRAAEEIAPGVLTMISRGFGQRHRHRRRAGDARHRRPVRRRPRLRRRCAGGAPTRRCAAAVYTHHHIDHVFGTDPLRGRGRRARLAAAGRVRPRGAARPLPALRAHAGMEHRHQPAPVRPCRSTASSWPDDLPLSRRHVPRPPDVPPRRV